MVPISDHYDNFHEERVGDSTLYSTNNKASEANLTESLSDLSRNVAGNGADSSGAITSEYRGGAEAIAQKSDFYDKGFNGTVTDSDTDSFDASKQGGKATGDLRPTSRVNPCPVCNDDSGDCRTHRSDSNFFLCHRFPSIPPGRSVGRYISFGETNGGRWGQFRAADLPPAKWDAEKQERYEAEKSLLSRNDQTKTSATLRPSLTAEKRHEGYSQLLEELALHPDDRADLIRRGFTDVEIAKIGYKSVSPWQRVRGDYHPWLAGIKDGQLITPAAGCLCPIRNENELIVAHQIRLRGEVKGGRYRWLSKGEGALHLYKDGKELPVNVCLPKEKGKTQVWLVDSVASKVALTSKRLGVPVIGAAGGMFGNSPAALKNGLGKASEFLGFTPQRFDVSVSVESDESDESKKPSDKPEVVIGLDAGAVMNPQVMKQWYATEALLLEWGYPISWAWWGQTEKRKRDIDEIDLTTTVIDFITTAKLKKEVRKELARLAQEPLRKLTHPADITIETRYMFDKNTPGDLDRVLAEMPSAGLMGWRVPKGGGKSTLIAERVKPNKSPRPGKGHFCVEITLSITPRIALGREQACKWKITWIGDKGKTRIINQSSAAEEAQITKMSERLIGLEEELKKLENAPQQGDFFGEGEDAYNRIISLAEEIDELKAAIADLIGRSFRQLGLCWDSLWKVRDRDMRGSLIILDEAELGITHLLTSDTCRETRAEILFSFEKIIQSCLLGGGLVLLADADLTDLSVDYVNSLLPAPMKPFIVRSDYRDTNTTYRIHFRTGSKDDTVDQLVEQIRAGRNVAVTTDNKKEAKAIAKLIIVRCSEKQKKKDLAEAIESGANREEIEEIQARKTVPLTPYMDEEGKVTQEALDGTPCIVEINSDTTRYAAGKSFVEHPNEEIKRIQPRVIVYTPSMGIGVSVDETTTKLNKLKATCPYFDVVYGFFFAVIEPSQARQQLGRIRANVDRVVWAVSFGLPEEGSTSYFPDEVSRQTRHYRNEGAIGLETLVKARLKDRAFRGKSRSSVFNDDQYMEEEQRLTQQFYDPKSRTWTNPNIIAYAKIKARRNYGRANFAKLLLEELATEGHEIASLPGVRTGTGDELEGYEAEEEKKEAEAIAVRPDISKEEADVIQDKGTEKTLEEGRTLKKHRLAEKLPDVPLSPELVLKAVVKGRGQWLRKHERFHWLQNFECVQSRDADGFAKLLRKGARGTIYAPDFQPEITKIKALKAIKLMDWIDLSDPEKQYAGDSEEAVAFLARCLEHKQQLRTAFNINVKENSSPTRILSRLLEEIGLNLEQGKRRSNGERNYDLKKALLDDPDPHREIVLEGLHRAWLRDSLPEEKGAKQVDVEQQESEVIEPVSETESDIRVEQIGEPCLDEVANLSKTPLEELREKLGQVTFWGAYRAATVGFRPEEIEAAIAAQSPEFQAKLQDWLQEYSIS